VKEHLKNPKNDLMPNMPHYPYHLSRRDEQLKLPFFLDVADTKAGVTPAIFLLDGHVRDNGFLKLLKRSWPALKFQEVNKCQKKPSKKLQLLSQLDKTALLDPPNK